MSNKTDLGGPAFPRPASTDEHRDMCNVYQDQQGMTLWDWYVAHATEGDVEAFMPATVGEAQRFDRHYRIGGSHDERPRKRRIVARGLYADAMLAERAKRGSE